MKVKVPETKYRRWRVVDLSNRVIEIDFRCIRNVPFKSVDYGSRRRMKWNSPAHLQGLVDEYFASCEGIRFNPRTGMPFMDQNGEPVICQIKPYTISGLACYIHIDTSSIKNYSREQIDDLGFPTDEEYEGPQYSDIINEARKRIEAFAEERLYDRDGFGGGRFVLNSAFGWKETREVAEVENMKKAMKMKKKEFELKRAMSTGDEEEEPITVNIIRASKKEEGKSNDSVS